MAKLIITLKDSDRGIKYNCRNNCPVFRWCGGVHSNHDCCGLEILGLKKDNEAIVKIERKE